MVTSTYLRMLGGAFEAKKYIITVVGQLWLLEYAWRYFSILVVLIFSSERKHFKVSLSIAGHQNVLLRIVKHQNV